MTQYARPRKSPATWAVVSVLLAVAVTGTLWIPLYARSAPMLGPFPFFYWFQLTWVFMTSALCRICFLLLRTKPDGTAENGKQGSLCILMWCRLWWWWRRFWW
jgi:hypothetical protein